MNRAFNIKAEPFEYNGDTPDVCPLCHNRIFIETEEVSLLSEVNCDLDDNGKIRKEPKYLRVALNIRFTLALFARKLVKIDYKIDTNCQEWRDLIKFIEIRNRITHPKSDKEIVINENAVLKVLNTATWFNHQVRYLLDILNIALKQSMMNRLIELKGEVTIK